MRYSLRTKTLDDSITIREESEGQVFIEAQPGDGTRYLLSFVSLAPVASKAIAGGPGYVLVSEMCDYKRIRSMVINPNGLVHFGVVEDRMGYSTASAITVAELIAYVTGCECVSREEFLRDNNATADEVRPSI